MEIVKTKTGDDLLIALSGRLDTTTAPDLEEVLKVSLQGTKKITLDFEKLVYISSAGLRIILTLQKKMSTSGSLIIKNVNEDIMDVFEMTGFSDILTIQ